MEKSVVGLLAILAAPLLLAVGVVVVAGQQPAAGAPPSGEAVADIPDELLGVYQAAAATCPGLPWAVLAAIGKVESDHARTRGATLTAAGEVTPPIIGPALDGSDGTRAIPDSDGGRWDGDTRWDHAVGPMQFIPTTWQRHATDANRDGTASPHQLHDAVHAAARYLCGAGAADPARLPAAVFAYNHAHWYVQHVLTLADRYSHTALTAATPAGGYTLPVARELLTAALLARPHHDYPAWDLPLPQGSPIHAVHGGTVIATPTGGRCGLGVVLHGHDGARYTYCHASRTTVTRGQQIQPGQLIALSGNTGNSSGPHLHLDITDNSDRRVCPQPLLQAWWNGLPASPHNAPTTGCTT